MSKQYWKSFWEDRYIRSGKTVGKGSEGDLLKFKSQIITEIIKDNSIESVIDWGCGDGRQTLLMSGFSEYIGLDLSEEAVRIFNENCKSLEKCNAFHISEYNGWKCDMSISLDVVFHLVDDFLYQNYMESLFNSAKKIVVIYSSNGNDGGKLQNVHHVKHREIVKWVEANQKEWELNQVIDNKYPWRNSGNDNEGSFCKFYIFKNKN